MVERNNIADQIGLCHLERLAQLDRFPRSSALLCVPLAWILLILLIFFANPLEAQKFPFNFNWDHPAEFPTSMESKQYGLMHDMGLHDLVRVSSYEDGHRTLKRYELDGKGRLAKISSAPFSELFIEHQDYIYDEKGRLRQVRGGGLNENNVSYAYDWGDRILLEEYSSGRGVEKPVTREYDYDKEGNLVQVKEHHGTYRMIYFANTKSGQTSMVKAIGDGEAYKWYSGDSVKWEASGDGLRMMQPPEYKLGRMEYDKDGHLISRKWSDIKPFPKQVVLVEKFAYDDEGRLVWHLVSTSEDVDSRDAALAGGKCKVRYRLDEYRYREDGLVKDVRTCSCEDGPEPTKSVEVYEYR